MQFRRLTSLLLTVFFVQNAWTADLKIPDAVNLSFTKVTLDNGLTVVIHEDHKAPIVAVNVWYHVGSANEPKGRNGFAHLFEHLMFQGSENFNDDYFQATQQIGATELNGTTSEDRTNYFQNVPSSALDTALFLESDRMGHFVNAITQAKLDEQRKVVLNEKRQREGMPYSLIEEKLAKGAFPVGHPYSWTTIGSEEDLNAATLDDVKNWFKTYYGPNNATLVIVGDVKTQEALEKVKKYFGDIPPGPRVSRTESWIATRNESKYETAQDYVPFAKMVKVYNIPGIGNGPDLTLLDMASDVLTIGKSSRLFKDIVYDKQLANDVSATIYPNEVASLFVIEATAKPGVSLEKLDAAVTETFQKFLKEGPTEEELTKAKTQYMTGFVETLEKIGGFGGKSNLLAHNQVYMNNPVAFLDDLKSRIKYTPADVRAAAQRWLSKGDYNLYITPYPKFTNTQPSIDRKKLPLPTSFPEAKFPLVEETKLSNGMRVLLARRTHVPSVELDLLFWTGFAKDPKDKKGLARLTFALLDEGTKKHNLFETEDILAKLGSDIDSFSGMNLSGLYMKSLKQNFEQTMDLVEETLLKPAFTDKEFARVQKELLQVIQQEKANPEDLGNRIFSQLIFGKDHPYGVPRSGTGSETSMGKLTRKDVVDFYDTWAKPNNATVIAIGDITMKELVASLEKHFSGWKKEEVPAFEIPNLTKEVNSGTVFVIDKPFAPQTMIDVGHLSPSFSDPKQAANFVLNLALGGSFTSRLNMNLREDKGWAYNAYSSYTDVEGKRYYQASTPVQTDKTIPAISEILKEISGMATQKKPLTQAEFEKQRKAIVLQLAGAWETNRSLFDPIKRLVYNNMDPNFYQTYIPKLQNLTLGEVVNSAKTTLRPNDLTWLLIGDKNKFMPELQKLGFKKIVVLDNDGNEVK